MKHTSRLLSATLFGVAAMAFLASCQPEKKELLSEVETHYSGSTSKIEYKYDENGNLLEEITRSGADLQQFANRVVYTYDEAQRLHTRTTYWQENASNRTTYHYTEKGDTLAIIDEVHNENQWTVCEKRLYAYDDAGQLTHKYDFNSMMAQGDIGYDMLVEKELDADGKVMAETRYNLDMAGDVYEIVLLSDVSPSPADELKRYITDYTMDPPVKVNYKYNDKGLLVSRDALQQKDGELKHVETLTREYDAQGNMTKETTSNEYSTTPVVVTSTYDDKGHKLTQHSEYSAGMFDDEVISYTEKGDTLQYVLTSNFGEKPIVARKIRNVYDEAGNLKERYCFSTMDEWGHDVTSVEKYIYNANGNYLSTESYGLTDFDLQLVIAPDYNGTPAEEYASLRGNYKMQITAASSYKYIELEVKNSFFGSLLTSGIFRKT